MRKTILSLFAALLGAALFTRDAASLDIEVPMEVPRLESISAEVPVGAGTAKVSYKGPRGKAKATVAVNLRVVDDVTSTFTLTLDDQGGGGVTTAKGRISGTATVATGYLVPSPGAGTVRGRLKNGRLELKAKHGPASLAFKGTSAVGGGYIGTLVSMVPPDAQKLTAFSIASIGRTGGGGTTHGPLAASLRSLGVKVEDSPRKDYSKTEDLPPDYAPFGSQRTFGRVNEIAMVGATLRGDASRFRVMGLAAVAGDFDGDGRSEPAVAVCRADSVDIVFFEDAASNFARQPALTKTYDDILGLTTPQMYAQLRCGNLDYDIGCETSFGQSTTSGSECETSVSIGAKAISGISLDGGPITQSSFELTQTTEVTATRIASRSYTLEETITYVLRHPSGVQFEVLNYWVE